MLKNNFINLIIIFLTIIFAFSNTLANQSINNKTVGQIHLHAQPVSNNQGDLSEFLMGKCSNKGSCFHRIYGYFNNIPNAKYFPTNKEFIQEYHPINYSEFEWSTDEGYKPEKIYKGDYKIIIESEEYEGKWWIDHKKDKWRRKEICIQMAGDEKIYCIWLITTKPYESKYVDSTAEYYYANPFSCNANSWSNCWILGKITKTEFVDNKSKKIVTNKDPGDLQGNSLYCEKDDYILFFEFKGKRPMHEVRGTFLSKDTGRMICEGCIKQHYYDVREFSHSYFTDQNWIHFDNFGLTKIDRKTLILHGTFGNYTNKDNLNIEDLKLGKIFTKDKIQCELNKKSKIDNTKKLKIDEVKEYLWSLERKYNKSLQDHALEIYNSKTSDNLL